VTFSNVEKGEHRVLVDYDGFSGEQTVILDQEDIIEYAIEIKVEKKGTNFILIISLSLVLILLCLVFWLKRELNKYIKAIQK
jgi:hypothetical protein